MSNVRSKTENTKISEKNGGFNITDEFSTFNGRSSLPMIPQSHAIISTDDGGSPFLKKLQSMGTKSIFIYIYNL